MPKIAGVSLVVSVQPRHVVGWWLGFVLLVLLGVSANGRLLAQESTTEEDDIPTAPVELDGTVLFRVRGVSSFPAETRAGRIRDQLVAVAADRTISIDALRIVDNGGVTRILAGDVVLMTVTDADARLEQVRRVELATTHLLRFRQALLGYREARSPAALRGAALSTLVATVTLIMSTAAILWLTRRLDRFLAARVQTRIHSVTIASFELMRADRIWKALRSVVFASRAITLLLAVLTCLGFVLGQFPWTRSLSQNMIGLAVVPLEVMGRGLISSIPSFVFLTVLFLVVRFALRLIRLFFDAVERGDITLDRFYPDWAQPTYKVVRLAMVAFALVVAYPYVPGSDTAAFQGVSLFIGILFSLGSTSAISNIIAGYQMTYRRALKVGDRVRIGNTTGDVIETRIQVTRLRSFKNEEIIIPNSQILANEVLNYSSLSCKEGGLILHTEVSIGYDIPWRQVEALLLAAADRTDGLLKEPPPYVLEKRLGDFAVTYEVNAYCTNIRIMNRLYAALHRSILDVFNEYGVQIMTPAYEGDPIAPKVVPREDWYAAPAPRPAASHPERDRALARRS